MFTKADHINLVIPRSALEIVFDECDRYDADETGGRILGTYKKHGDTLTVTVTGIIEPGPEAHRTATYFKQDGAYQERVFRQVEEREPSIEHLGNWHTHHVNALRHLSGGDVETYRRTVEHEKHNTDFFYALLVTERKNGKTGLQRYTFKNYMLRRGDASIYEIPASAITLIDAPLVWPSARAVQGDMPRTSHEDALKTNLVYDSDVVSKFYPKVKPFKSEKLGIYWRGTITLVDGSELEAVILQDELGKTPVYTVTLRNADEMLARSIKTLSKDEFTSCRAALVATERMCNAELFENRAKKKRGRLWTF